MQAAVQLRVISEPGMVSGDRIGEQATERRSVQIFRLPRARGGVIRPFPPVLPWHRNIRLERGRGLADVVQQPRRARQILPTKRGRKSSRARSNVAEVVLERLAAARRIRRGMG